MFRDVDALNQRARAAALTAGDVYGPVLVVAGGRTWQAGDLLRARRNDRRLALGDGHVRNGDRFTVLGPGPGGGLVVEDLAGRGRTSLPGSYLAQHATYGWRPPSTAPRAPPPTSGSCSPAPAWTASTSTSG